MTRAAQEPVSPNLIDESRWWTAPGSAADAIDYLDSHPPAGLMLSGHSESRNATATLTSTVMFSDGSASTAYDNSQLLVTVVDRGGHVDVRADAQAIWLPPRANADAIAGAVTSLDATIDRQQSLPTVNRALDGTDARAVVNAINALSPVTPGTYNCPADLGWTDTLVVHRASGDIKVIVDVTGCANVYIGTTAARPALSGGRGIDQQLVTALGLPASYAQ